MRIRRSASKILGSASCQSWLSSPDCAADELDPPAGDVCELNRSPWDVSPAPYGSGSDLDHSLPEVEEDDEVIKGIGVVEEEHIRVVPRKVAVTKEKANSKKEMLDEEATKGKKRKISKKQAVEEKKRDDITVASLKLCRKRCNKGDGKGWRCKKPAQHPHTLCRYHLAQLRSYNASYRTPTNTAVTTVVRQGRVNTAVTTALQQSRATSAAAAAAETGSDFYYYYSGFGPWRGKKRRGDEAAADDDNGSGDKKQSKSDDADDGDNADNADNAHDEIEEDNGSTEEMCRREEEKKKKPGCHGKKRGRKRIKARSLKSLL